VIQSNRGKIATYYGLSVSKRFASEDPRLAALETFAREPASLSDEDRMYLHLALSKAHDDLGRHERSFARLVEGNCMKRRQLGYDEANALGFMDRCCDFFTPDHFRRKAGRGNPSRAPVFIVGMMRSGGTLVEEILSSHPQIFGGGERPHFEKSPIATPQGAGVRHTPSYLAATPALDDPWIGVLAAHLPPSPDRGCARGTAHHRQPAWEFHQCWVDPSRPAERADHSHHPRSA
jgi:hypothetical protein